MNRINLNWLIFVVLNYLPYLVADAGDFFLMFDIWSQASSWYKVISFVTWVKKHKYYLISNQFDMDERHTLNLSSTDDRRKQIVFP